MATRRLVLILGAGSSAPYGFPSGKALVQQLVRLDAPLLTFLRQVGHPEEACRKFSSELERASAPSIDAFLANRAEFREIGKGAISHVIAQCENGTLFEDRPGDWYGYFFELILRDRVENRTETQITILTFNYDRSLEFWLAEKVRAFYGKALPSPWKIAHLHGSIGSLDATSPEFSAYEDETIEHKRNGSRCIRIIDEASHEDEAFGIGHEALRTADTVVFLGFGFHPENIERLRLDNCSKRDGRVQFPRELRNRGIPSSASIFGTTLGFTASEVGARILPQFKEYGGIKTFDLDVLDFLRKHNELFR